MQSNDETINDRVQTIATRGTFKPIIKPKHGLTATEQNRLKKWDRKHSEGRFGKFISWIDHLKDKNIITEKNLQELFQDHGRIGNKLYKIRINGKVELAMKFKNATKAKKFMERLRQLG